PCEGRSGDISLGVDGPSVMSEDPYAYVVAAFQALPSPDCPEYPKYIPPEDEVFPGEEQPLPAAASPTTDSPGYIPESDPDEDLEDDGDEDPEDDDEDLKEDPADYPADHDDDDEEEEHLASADSIPPPPALRVMDRISSRPQPPTLFFTKEDAERFLAMPIPPPSPLTPLSSPLPQIPSPPLPASPPILPILLPAASPPLQLLSSDCRADRPEVTLPPQKRLSIVHCPGYEVGESLAAAVARPIEGRRADYRFVDSVEAEISRRIAEDIIYGIRDTWIDPRDIAEEEVLTTLEGVNTRVTELAAVQDQDTQDIYGVMEDTQGRQTEIFQRVEALVNDSQYHYETGRLVDQEAIVSREAWAHFIGLSSAKMAPKRAAPRRTTRLNPGATSNPNPAPSTTTTTVTNAQLQAMIDQGVNAALAARDANRTGDDSHTSGTGVRRTEHVTRECTYQDFMKCQPLYFKGTEGVVELTQWFERMETVFRISNCLAKNQVKFATCTLLAGALTWWNSHVRIFGTDASYVITWIELKKKMADKYCLRNEMKKIETELWNLEVQGTDLTRYNQRFQELALLCVRTCPEESDRVERYIGDLPDSIYGSVEASKPKTMQEATEMTTGLMDKKIRTYAERQAANKRKFEDTSRNNQSRQQPPKRQDVARAYAAASGNMQQYAGSRPLCPKCNFNHDGTCIPRCYKCNNIGHLARDCRSPTNANVANNYRGNEAGQKATCYECGAQGHFKRNCPKLKNNNKKNNNHGNQVGTGNAQARVYTVGIAGTNPDANTVTGTFLLNNCYASVLFD
nr:hypothetical protein [Tanacetum cinerariifolium]